MKLADRIRFHVELWRRTARKTLCALSEHGGEFYIAKLSTADLAPAPHIFCADCHADARGVVFAVVKRRDEIVITNISGRARKICGPHDETRIHAGETQLYFAGAFIPTQIDDAEWTA